jgi:uncharacterized repeat protein (TIGR03803 family)
MARKYASLVSAAGSLLLAACGGGGYGGGGSSPPGYTVGGSVSGLTTSGLVLLNNGGDATTVAANATQFTMYNRVALGGSYAITVTTEPTGSTCTVSNGSGSNLTGNITSVTISCKPARTFTEMVLASFAGGSEGSGAQAALIERSDGNFYGATVEGGANGFGTVFRITPAGLETVLHSFAGGSDGSGPQAGPIEGSDGNFYGTTAEGGANGFGTVFRITSAGVETALHSFAGGSDGSGPHAGLIEGSDGNFYGTTSAGGADNWGTVFRITPGGVETVLHSFAGGSDGSQPLAGLIEGSDRNFYGTTSAGGADNWGTVFRITPDGVESVLHSFGSGSGVDGVNPYAGLIEGSDGNFYGTTKLGGMHNLGTGQNRGTVFRITPAGVETVLYSFAGGSDGSQPLAGLIEGSDGNFYGTTSAGGANNSGTVFRITPTGVETVLHSFGSGGDGSNPYAGLLVGSNGNLYGTTRSGGSGGCLGGCGTVFELVPH